MWPFRKPYSKMTMEEKSKFFLKPHKPTLRQRIQRWRHGRDCQRLGASMCAFRDSLMILTARGNMYAMQYDGLNGTYNFQLIHKGLE